MNSKIKIKFKKLHSDAQLPTKSEGNIGWDLYYCGENIQIKNGETKILETGISWEPPENYHGLIWDRSGLAAKHNLHTLAGVIDSTYRGEIKIILSNMCSERQFETVGVSQIDKGDRIAQLIIQKEVPVELQLVEELSETDRGKGGFGSSGK